MHKADRMVVSLRVYDHKNSPSTDETPDIEAIAKNESWAQGLVYTNMEGFAVSEDGQLMLLDQCGNYANCPKDRFKWSIGLELVNR